MKKFWIKVVSFFLKDHTAKYIVVMSAFLTAFTVLLWLAAMDVVSNVFGTVVGFMISSMFLYACKIIVGRMEDILKINYDTHALLEIYHGRPDYRKSVQSQGTEATFAYAEVLVNQNYDFNVEDHPERKMELDEFIMGNYATLFSAHSNSAKRNFDTIRLDRFDPETKTFYLSRSTYFNHLVTNRAIDFLLFDDVSLRTVYEYGPQLNRLEDSKMSNHIGINALVFLSDGRLLIPRRKNSATISKNKITSSIAVMLTFPNECSGDPKHAVITKDYLLHGNIIKNLSDRVKLPAEAVCEDQTEITFLGFGQNIYEGGKPQFYYSVKLNNVDTETYFAQRKVFEAEQKRLHKKEVIDVDQCMYVADYDSFRYVKNCVEFTVHSPKGKTSKVRTGYEMSYLCNLWHYNEWNKAMKAD